MAPLDAQGHGLVLEVLGHDPWMVDLCNAAFIRLYIANGARVGVGEEV